MGTLCIPFSLAFSCGYPCFLGPRGPTNVKSLHPIMDGETEAGGCKSPYQEGASCPRK